MRKFKKKKKKRKQVRNNKKNVGRNFLEEIAGEKKTWEENL
jgi:hypothetical protein